MIYIDTYYCLKIIYMWFVQKRIKVRNYVSVTDVMVFDQQFDQVGEPVWLSPLIQNVGLLWMKNVILIYYMMKGKGYR